LLKITSKTITKIASREVFISTVKNMKINIAQRQGIC